MVRGRGRRHTRRDDDDVGTRQKRIQHETHELRDIINYGNFNVIEDKEYKYILHQLITSL